MRLVPVFTTLALALGGFACTAGLTNDQVITWLDAKAGAPDLNVGGDWDSVKPFYAGGWGSGSWEQKGAKVTGALGLYSVEGRVVGKKLYLALFSNGKVYYTVVLEPTKTGGLTGLAASGLLADDESSRLQDRTPMELARAEAPAK